MKKFKIREEYESLMKEARSKIEKLTKSNRKKVKEGGHEVLDDFKERNLCRI